MAAKRFSGKAILSLAVFMWSLSTFITPFFAESLSFLIVLRVILGIGEGLGEFCCRMLPIGIMYGYYWLKYDLYN